MERAEIPTIRLSTELMLESLLRRENRTDKKFTDWLERRAKNAVSHKECREMLSHIKGIIREILAVN